MYFLSYIEDVNIAHLAEARPVHLAEARPPRTPNRVDVSRDLLPTAENKPTCKTTTSYYIACGVSFSIAAVGFFLMTRGQLEASAPA